MIRLQYVKEVARVAPTKSEGESCHSHSLASHQALGLTKVSRTRDRARARRRPSLIFFFFFFRHPATSRRIAHRRFFFSSLDE